MESEEKITANENAIAELKANAKGKKAEMKVQYEKTIAEIEAENEALKVRVRDRKETTNEKWQEFKRDVEEDFTKLGDKIKEAYRDDAK
ncbi:MAG: hypothetical protein PHQ74_06050 [Crocinitomicaceae bacterium]|nr:hypothetical protein [Crocinitomicaceae bacterium]